MEFYKDWNAKYLRPVFESKLLGYYVKTNTILAPVQWMSS